MAGRFMQTALLCAFLSATLAWGEMKVVQVPVDADGVQRINVLGGEYFFDPGHIVVKVNVPVELKVRKDGWFIPHDLVARSPEAGIDFSLSLGSDPQLIRFTPTKTGKYPMYCTKKPPFLKSHRDKGMEGLIEVVE